MALLFGIVTTPLSSIVTPSGFAPSIVHVLLSFFALTFLVSPPGVWYSISIPSSLPLVGGVIVTLPDFWSGVIVGGAGLVVSSLGPDSLSDGSFALASTLSPGFDFPFGIVITPVVLSIVSPFSPVTVHSPLSPFVAVAVLS